MIDFKEYFLLELEEAYKTFCKESKKLQNNNKQSDPKVNSSKKNIKNNFY